MKNFKTYFMILSSAGVIFSGYMSGVKLFTKTCAFGETCPYIFGMPACYIGFLLFLILFIVSIMFMFGKLKVKDSSNIFLVTSLVGVIYSLYFAIPELPLLFENGFKAYMLGLPTCVMGSIFFITIFVGAIYFYKETKKISA